MRPRVVIAAGILVIGGGMAALLFRPWESSVEYHLRGYKRAVERLESRGTLMGSARLLWRALLRPASQGRHDDWRELLEHEGELVRLGYLEERIFIISNVPLSNLSYAINKAVVKRSTNQQFFRAGMSGTNGIGVVTRKGDMPALEEVKSELNTRTNQ